MTGSLHLNLCYKFPSFAIQLLKESWIKEKERLLAILAAKQQQVTERLERLTDAYLDQVIERDLFEERKMALLLERRAIEDQLNEIKSGRRSTPEAIQKFLELANDASFLFKMAIPEKRRRLLKIVSSNLTLDQETPDFTYVQPFQEIANRTKNHDGGPSKGLARTLDALIASLTPQIDACAAITASFENNPDN